MIDHIFLEGKVVNLDITNLPNRSFPPKILFDSKKYLVSGYFVNYDNLVKEEDLIRYFEHNQQEIIINSNSEFLLFYLDKNSGTLQVLSDQFNSVPIYFSYINKKLILSTKLSKVLDVVKHEVNIKLDLDGLFTWLVWEWHSTEKTLFEDIKVLPPGCSVFFDSNGFRIKSLVRLADFLDIEAVIYSDNSNYAKDWVKTINEVVDSRYRKMRSFKIGSDLSSGFDCTLISYSLSLFDKELTCYSRISEVTPDETNLDIMENFSRFHNLNLKILDITDDDRLILRDHSKWKSDDPFQIRNTSYESYLKFLENDGVKIMFTGEGGDEAYSSAEMDLFSFFPVQNSYFNNVSYFRKMGIEKLFSKKAIDFVLSRGRFNQRAVYPMIAPVSSAIPSASTSWSSWEKDIWFTNPFFDTRAISMARLTPRNLITKKLENKVNVLKYLPEIFPSEMFVEKGGREGVYGESLKNNCSFYLEVLSNSYLAKQGLIDSDKIISWLSNESDLLKDSEIAIVLNTIVQIDWFLQKNLDNDRNLRI